MKAAISNILFCILLTFARGAEPIKVGQKFAQLRTQDGRVYSNVTVRKIERYGLRISHESGAATISAEQLPQYRDQFGSKEEIQNYLKQLERAESNSHQDQSSGANSAENPESKSGTDQKKFQAALEKAEAQRVKVANIEAARRAAEKKMYAENPEPTNFFDPRDAQDIIARLANTRAEHEALNPPQERRDFSSGFATGYKKANPWGFAPFAPFPTLGHDSYEDGYGVGYAAGLADDSALSERYKRK